MFCLGAGRPRFCGDGNSVCLLDRNAVREERDTGLRGCPSVLGSGTELPWRRGEVCHWSQNDNQESMALGAGRDGISGPSTPNFQSP